ncbi:MAG: hypothetical protein DRR16_28910 [Candidatus Parabeggiatoa sp. nov. 3]|nr:MAG: hypothetical protein DRR00_32140 [Gammaproteobacteria bacterium]RKZ52000.1 MAG: hypothetical protein DRQ99_32805 [Gammaproteobacteria bacterium]RKZ77825.1 MAG: hypothetical protein DRR16_28910 [Gammaproteobacteria bacterium]
MAISDLTVVKSIEDISLHKNRKIVKSGKRLNLIDCVNIKHYILPKVQLEDKTEVYVIDGQFKIEHFPIWHTEGNIIFSDCPW